jgi:hypothetical protein
MIKKQEVLNAIELGNRELEEANDILDGNRDNYDGADGARAVSGLADELIYIAEHLLCLMGDKEVM